MGVEFIEKATPSFKKSWDRRLTELGTADLFTRVPACAARTAAADILGGARLEAGETLTVEAQNGTLIARRGIGVVARFSRSAPELVQAVKDSCGVAKGTVERVHPLAGVAEISLC